ncbi:MAG: hypothetical protein V4643_14645 [Bacteroidota bacterium]
MKKAILAMKPIVLLAMILSLSFTSCKKGWWGYEEENGGGGKGGGGKGGQTHVKGTIYTQGCGIGIYGDGLWIKLDDGTLLQPCAQSFQTLCPIVLHEGDRVELSYSAYKGDYPDFQPYCDMMMFPFKRVTIDFINVINKPVGTCKPVTVPNNYDQLDLAQVNIGEASIVGTSLKLNIGYSGCSKNAEKFGLVGKLISKGSTLTYEIKLTDAAPEMCQAYFTEDLCFDLQSLRNATNSSRVKIKLIGFGKELIL